MAATLTPSPVPTPSASAPPTPPYPSFPRLPHTSPPPHIHRNASTSSSRSTTTVSSTSSSLIAAPIRPPPIETRTAATTPTQLPSRTSTPESYSSPLAEGQYGGRGFMRNGPRSASRHGTIPPPPHIVTSSPSPSGHTGSPLANARSRTAPSPIPSDPPRDSSLSPTTPRQNRFSAALDDSIDSSTPVRVTVSMDAGDASPPSPMRGRSNPPSPIIGRGGARGGKTRTLSVDAGQERGDRFRDRDKDRERRESMASAKSAGSSSAGAYVKKPSIRDFVLGEELGRGSYSTVVQATAATQTQSPTSPRPPRQYAIKIINQAHLVAEKKVKYAMIERDALVRLAMPSGGAKGHRRGMSSSSTAGNRRSTASIGNAGPTPRRDSHSTAVGIPISSGTGLRLGLEAPISGSSNGSAPKSPTAKTALAGRRPSRSADTPEMVVERSDENAIDSPVEIIRSRPPSPVREESAEHAPQVVAGTPATRARTEEDVERLSPTSAGDVAEERQGTAGDANGRKSHEGPNQTPKKRRQSLAPSERSLKSSGGGGHARGHSGRAHPGVIRLHSTFNDSTSLYFVLDLASNGELLGFIRKYGSLDIESTRYYAAQLIDTIEFMHDRGVLHRDLKPENILLDENMRIKITDFGSAKLLDKDKVGDGSNDTEGKKRSFVGSADFVSPEVLRNEPAGLASDIWAFGCILYQFIVGKPPFRGATDYLTFQKILKKEMEYPAGFDEEAQDLIEKILDLDPSLRPSPQEIKQHPFFFPIDFVSIWTTPAPPITTGLTRPVTTLASADQNSDLWAVFDDEVSDGGFEYDDDGSAQPSPAPAQSTTVPAHHEHRISPHYDAQAAAEAVQAVGGDELAPPQAVWIEGGGQARKGRGWSRGSRTSSSSSANRTALAGLLETMGIGGSRTGTGAGQVGSSRTSRTSNRSDEMRGVGVNGGGGSGAGGMRVPREGGQAKDSQNRWSNLLLANERVIHSSPINIKSSSNIPLFHPAPKRRQLVLTDFPRLICIKPDEGSVKAEYVFVTRPTGGTIASVGSVGRGGGADAGGVANRVVDVGEKGVRGMFVQTATRTDIYLADTADTRDAWLAALRGVMT